MPVCLVRGARRRIATLLAALAGIVSLAGAAAATPQPVRAFVVGAGPGGTPSREAVQGRVGERVDLHAVVQVGRGRRALYYTDAPALRDGRRVRAAQIRPFAALGATSVRWSRVEPRQHHVDTPAPNAPNPAYSNSVLFGPQHGRWLGYDTLEYVETPLPTQPGPSVVVTRAVPSDPRQGRRDGLGTLRYKVDVTLRAPSVPGLAAGVLASPGAEATERGGVREEVFRVSFRRGDDLVGWLTSYFNVPNVFGSAGHGGRHQTDRYQGADCADVIVGAARRAGAQLAYTSASGLTRYARPVTGLLVMDETGVYAWDGEAAGEPVRLAVPDDVRPGDIVLIDYVGFTGSPRSWDHVGVLADDRGDRGRLDPLDPLLHVGYLSGLTEESLRSQGPAILQVLRLGSRHERAIDRRARQLAHRATH